MTELVPNHDPHWFDTYSRVASTGEAVRFEQYGSGLGRWFDVYATRLGGPGSDKVAILFSDITDRKRAEEDLRRLAAELAEIDRRKTEFLATLAHELRNPLAPLTNGLQLMRMAGEQSRSAGAGPRDDGAPAQAPGAAGGRPARHRADHPAARWSSRKSASRSRTC